MEIITIVDENDKKIGEKDRTSIKKEDIYRVSALWISNSCGEVLLAQRAFTKKQDPGCWGPAVAGTVRVAESYDENIYRETEEEIGLKDIVFKKANKIERIGPKRAHNYFVQWFKAIIDEDITKFKFDKKEVADLKWFNIDSLKAQIKKTPEDFLESVRLIISGEMQI